MAAPDELSDAHEWIVLAIAAGHTATRGAGPIRVHVGEASSVSFAGVSLTLEQLEQLGQLEQGLAAPSNCDDALTDDLLHLLDLASTAARSLGAALEIESLGHGSCLTLRVDANGQRQLDHSTLPLNDTGLRVSVLGGRDRRSERERELIHERCWLTSTAIFLDEEQISRGPAAAFDQPRRTTKILLHGREVGEAALERLDGEPGKAFIVSRGVLVETVALADCSAGFVAVAELDLPLDRSARAVMLAELQGALRTTNGALWQPAAQASARSWQTLVAVAVVGTVVVSLIVFAIVRWHLDQRLHLACEAGDRNACATLIEQTDDAQQRMTLWKLSCEAGDLHDCLVHAVASYTTQPDESLATVLELCANNWADACDAAVNLAEDPERAVLVARRLCQADHDAALQCRSWIELARDICTANVLECAELREALGHGCIIASRDACLEAGWMHHLGYGGPRAPKVAKQLFDIACAKGNQAACEWRQRSAVSPQSCADGDRWACYALGVEAYASRRTFGKSAVDTFARACELKVAAGCDAVGLAHIQTDKRHELAIRWFENACLYGSREGCNAAAVVENLKPGQQGQLEHGRPLLALPGGA